MDTSTYKPAHTVRPCEYSGRKAQLGFSILEVLIAIIILSIGMLGAVGMQSAALQSNKEARNQAAATTFGRELAEKMRGNHTTAIKTAAADNPFIFDITLTSATTITTPSTNCFTATCANIKDAATWEVADWMTRVREALPTPRVKVCFDSSPFDAAGLPEWDCSDTGDIAVLKMSWTRTNTAGTLEFANTTGIPVVVVPLTAGSTQ